MKKAPQATLYIVYDSDGFTCFDDIDDLRNIVEDIDDDAAIMEVKFTPTHGINKNPLIKVTK